MVELKDDLRLALDRVAFAEELGIVPDPWQYDLLQSGADRVLLLCSRQSGKSTMSAILALHRALYHPGSLVLCLAPSERQAKELFSKVAQFYRDLGFPVPSDSHRKLGIQLANGSRVEALPGSEKTVRGFSAVSLLLLDEAARVEDGLYTATLPMLAVSGGRLIMMSTPFGKRGIFHKMWTEGVGWERYTVTADECPRIGPDTLEEARLSMSEWEFRQEYLCEFADSEAGVFGLEDIEKAVDDEIQPLFPGGVSPA